MGIDDIVNELENKKVESTEYRKRLKALTQLYILNDRVDLVDDITNLYRFIVNCTTYPEQLLRIEMVEYKKKLNYAREIDDIEIFPSQRGI